VPGREQLDDLVVDDLVADGRSDTAGAGETCSFDDRTVLRDTDERCSEPAGREDLVGRGGREEVVESLAELSSPCEERC
jgi:hypothetical protein